MEPAPGGGGDGRPGRAGIRLLAGGVRARRPRILPATGCWIVALALATTLAPLAAGPAPVPGGKPQLRGPGNGRTDHPVNTWVLQSPRPGKPAPPLLYEGSGAWDPLGDQWIHFGGHDGIPQGSHLFTWSAHSAAWEQRFPDTSPPGVCCVDGSNTFDEQNRRFVAFPGASLGHGYQWSRSVRLKRSNVWLYDPAANRWTNMRPPPYRVPEKYSREVIGGIGSGSAFDPVTGLVYAFGGTGAGGATNALFAYDTHANRLERIEARDSPPPRDGMGFTCVWRHRYLLLFGSQYLSDARTWIFDLDERTWSSHDLDPHPPAAKGKTYSTIPRMAYDPHRDAVLCLAWLGEARGHETWSFNAASRRWSNPDSLREPDPSKSRSRNLSFSRTHDVFVLETTAVSGGPQIWTYRHPGEPRLSAGTGLPALPPVRSRPEPSIPVQPLVSVLSQTEVEVSWRAHPDSTVSSYNVYRGVASVDTVKKGTPGAWRDNDPEYCTPVVVAVKDISSMSRLNAEPLQATTFPDGTVKLFHPGVESGPYRHAVHAYIVRAVSKAGVESGPSPWALTIPSAPRNVLLREEEPDVAHLRWDPSPERGVVGYHIYRLERAPWTVARVTVEPITGTTFRHRAGAEISRYWVVAVDGLGQEGEPSSPVWYRHDRYRGFYHGEWHH